MLFVIGKKKGTTSTLVTKLWRTCLEKTRTQDTRLGKRSQLQPLRRPVHAVISVFSPISAAYPQWLPLEMPAGTWQGHGRSKMGHWGLGGSGPAPQRGMSDSKCPILPPAWYWALVDMSLTTRCLSCLLLWYKYCPGR